MNRTKIRSFIFYWRLIDNIVKISVERNPSVLIEACNLTLDEFDEKGDWQGVKKENAEVQEEDNATHGL